MHVGQYQCETTENGVAFRHRFNLFLTDTSTIEIKPSEIMCTNSSEIVIHCTWRSGHAQHSSSVSVDALSKPVLVDKSVDISDGIGFVAFKICLFANPRPFQMKWYDNDQPLNGLIVVNSTFLETPVEISVYGTTVNITGYFIFLQTKQMPLSSSTIYKCHIENSLGFINVVFNDLNTPKFESDMHVMSTMEIPSIKMETRITTSLQIYIPVASCVMLVCLLLTAVFIVLRKKSIKEKKGKPNVSNIPENRESIDRDNALQDARPQSVPSVHVYEDVEDNESISSSDSDQSYINRGYANSNNEVRDDSHYINTIALRVYEDLDPNTRNEINIYDRRVDYNC
ncbi:unnamed protein product [Mytilus edulis]|uniref:Ig-like domain-containing protein n=1 Tax=Mytilus edulis TaxID=6550 RepID=A0A8S3QLV8_MYTED|nr:unnamed protein product [Mytilus edulis]